MDVLEIMRCFDQSLQDFIDSDADLLWLDSNERAISHKLAERMAVHFSQWNIDCEYDRIGTDRKKKLVLYSRQAFIEAKAAGIIPDSVASLEEIETSDDAAAVYPDIIVHKRGDVYTNLLIVEIKKASNPEVKLGWDQWKIKFLIT